MPDRPSSTDPYLDPSTRLLRNLVGATTAAQFERAEADLTYARALQLVDQPVPVTGELTQLTTIHRRLFQDVYDWAGELGTVDLRKNTPAAQHFMPVSRLTQGAGFAFQELADDRMLRGLDQTTFVDRLAHHFDQVNYLHPFRDGNGRTQRIFWSQIADAAGYSLDWQAATRHAKNLASRQAMEHQDLEPLRRMLHDVVQPRSSTPLDPELAPIVEVNRRNFPTIPTAVTRTGTSAAPAARGYWASLGQSRTNDPDRGG